MATSETGDDARRDELQELKIRNQELGLALAKSMTDLECSRRVYEEQVFHNSREVEEICQGYETQLRSLKTRYEDTMEDMRTEHESLRRRYIRDEETITALHRERESHLLRLHASYEQTMVGSSSSSRAQAERERNKTSGYDPLISMVSTVSTALTLLIVVGITSYVVSRLLAMPPPPSSSHAPPPSPPPSYTSFEQYQREKTIIPTAPLYEAKKLICKLLFARR